MSEQYDLNEYDEETLRYLKLNKEFMKHIIPVLEVDNNINSIENYNDQQLGIGTESKIFLVSNSGNSTIIDLTQCPHFTCNSYYQDQSFNNEISFDINEMKHTFCFNSMDSIWVSYLTVEHGISLIDLRVAPGQRNGTYYKNLTEEPIYQMWKLGDNHLLVASSLSENILSLYDSRNISMPIQVYPFHNAYIKKIQKFPHFFYSIDEDGDVFKHSYETQNLLGHFKFSQDQQMNDVTYNYRDNHFVTLIENKILYHTEEKLFDVIEDNSIYQSLVYNKLFNRLAFGQTDMVVFCDNKCNEQYYFDKVHDKQACANITPFKSSFIFSDGHVLYYDTNVIDQ